MVPLEEFLSSTELVAELTFICINIRKLIQSVIMHFLRNDCSYLCLESCLIRH